MTPEFWIAIAGMVSTLSGVLITSWWADRRERQRMDAADERRWQGEQFELLKALQQQVVAIDHHLTGAHRSYELFRRNTGHGGDRELMASKMLERSVDRAFKAESKISRAHDHLAILELLVSGPVLSTAVELLEMFSETQFRLDTLEDVESILEALTEARVKRAQLAEEIRILLRAQMV